MCEWMTLNKLMQSIGQQERMKNLFEISLK